MKPSLVNQKKECVRCWHRGAQLFLCDDCVKDMKKYETFIIMQTLEIAMN